MTRKKAPSRSYEELRVVKAGQGKDGVSYHLVHCDDEKTLCSRSPWGERKPLDVWLTDPNGSYCMECESLADVLYG